MNAPPTEQLIRDYLNRVSVAARGRLSPEDRRAFLATMREAIERNMAAVGAGRAEVKRMLSGLGDPAALVDRELARLAAIRGQPLAEPEERPPGLAARWRGLRHADLSSPVTRLPVPEPAAPADGKERTPGQRRSAQAAAAHPADEAPLTSETRIHARPITSRWRPGEPLQPVKPESGRPRPAPRFPAEAGPAQGGDSSQPGPSRRGRPRLTAILGGARTEQPDDSGIPPEAAIPESSAGQSQPAPPARPDRSAWPPGQPPGQRQPPGLSLQPEQAGPGDDPGADPDRGTRGPAATLATGLARQVVTVARAGPLEFTAVVILGLGGLIYPPVWLIGAVVALFSRIWDARDKWIGLAGPPLLVIFGSLAAVTLGGQQASMHRYVHEAWMSASYLSRIGAVLGAAYLAWRLRNGRRTPAEPPWNRAYHVR